MTQSPPLAPDFQSHDAEVARRYPRPAMILAMSNELAKDETFQGEQLAEAYYDWRRDGALLYEGDRDEVIEAAWTALGLPDAEENAAEDGWNQWVRFTVAECALLHLMAKEIVDMTKQHGGGAFLQPTTKAPA